LPASETTRQVGGGAPLGLALLLERGGAGLVAPPQRLGAGVELLELVAAVTGARPTSAAGCRARGCAVTVVRLRVAVAAVVAWVQRVAVLPGWRLEHVAWDMVEGTGDFWTWTLRGRDAVGGEVWLRVELAARIGSGCIGLRPRRCWLLGTAVAAERVWDALARRLVGPGIRVRDGWLEIDALRAALGPAFAAAGWRLPAGRGLVGGELRVEDGAVLVTLRADPGAFTWPPGQVDDGRVDGGGWSLGQVETGWSSGQVDMVRSSGQVDVGPAPLGRGWLAHRLAGQARRSRASGGAFEPSGEVGPAVAGMLARARAQALRFRDRAGCIAALRAWIAACPADGEAWWILAVQQALRGEMDGLDAALVGLQALPADEHVQLRRRLALALHRREHAPAVRALLEPVVPTLSECPAELQAGVWRALARARAADPSVSARAVEDAVTAALGEEGWRRRGEAGELRVQVAGALLASGRGEADTARLLRRLLADRRPVRSTRRGERIAAADEGDPRSSMRIVADYFAQEGRWTELVTLLEGAQTLLEGPARIEALRQIARIHRHHLHDPAGAERALASASEPGDAVAAETPERRD
jgi:hypothetical protein